MKTTTLETKNRITGFYMAMIWAIRLSGEYGVLGQIISDEEAARFAEAGIDVKGLTRESALNVVKNWLFTTKVA